MLQKVYILSQKFWFLWKHYNLQRCISNKFTPRQLLENNFRNWFKNLSFELIWTYCITNTEQKSKNIFTYIKTHYGETILAKIRKLEKTMIKYSSYTNHLRFSLCCHHSKILRKDLQLKSRIMTERSER